MRIPCHRCVIACLYCVALHHCVAFRLRRNKTGEAGFRTGRKLKKSTPRRQSFSSNTSSKWYEPCQQGKRVHTFRETDTEKTNRCHLHGKPWKQCPGNLPMFCYDAAKIHDSAAWCCCGLDGISRSGRGRWKYGNDKCALEYQVQATLERATAEKQVQIAISQDSPEIKIILEALDDAHAVGWQNAEKQEKAYLIIQKFLDDSRQSLEPLEFKKLRDGLWANQKLCTRKPEGGKSVQDMLDDLDENRKTALTKGYSLQQHLLSKQIPAAFHSCSIAGMFRQAWNAAVYAPYETPPKEPNQLADDFEFAFIPRLQKVGQVLNFKQELFRKNLSSEPTPLQTNLESKHLISASPRIDDCTPMEAFLVYYVGHTASSAATELLLTDVKKNLIQDDMMIETISFLKVSANSPRANQLETHLLQLWNKIKQSPDLFPVMTVFAAYQQVGRSLYQSFDYGNPKYPGIADERADLMEMAESDEQVTDPETGPRPHQFRVRPYSAEEIISVGRPPSHGFDGLVGFRFPTPEQKRFWGSIYDKMVGIIGGRAPTG